MQPNAPYFIILLCPMPDDFTRQGGSADTQWDVNQPKMYCALILMCPLLCLMPDNFTCRTTMNLTFWYQNKFTTAAFSLIIFAYDDVIAREVNINKI